jgi:succinate dehydrogenase / fumarate reductase, cytochrome b subunit
MSSKGLRRYTIGMKYRGGGPMLASQLHRLTAIIILVFVGLHVVASLTSQVTGAGWASWFNNLYWSPVFQVIVLFSVIFHCVNGLRVTLLDFFPSFLRFQREAIWVQWALILPVFALTALLIIQSALRGG